MEACTNLSKESSSNQLMCGIDLPGILHKANITEAQAKAGKLDRKNIIQKSPSLRKGFGC